MGSDLRTFSLSLPWTELRTQEGKELVASWATTLIALPGSGIEAHEVERLLDFIEERYSPTRTMATPKKRRLGFFGL